MVLKLSDRFDSGLLRFLSFSAEERTWVQTNPTTVLGLHRALIVPNDKRQWLEGKRLCSTGGVRCIVRGGVAYLPIRVAIALSLPEFEQWMCGLIPPEVV